MTQGRKAEDIKQKLEQNMRVTERDAYSLNVTGWQQRKLEVLRPKMRQQLIELRTAECIFESGRIKWRNGKLL